MEKITYIYKAVVHLNLMSQAFIFVMVVAMGVLQGYIFKKHRDFSLYVVGGVHLFFGAILALMMKYDIMVHCFVFIIPSFLIASVIYIFVGDPIESKKDPFVLNFFANNGGFKKAINLLRGVVIFGAAGSGKTFTTFSRIIKHMVEFLLSGVIYDHKDFELANVFYNYHGQQTLKHLKYLDELREYKEKIAVDHGSKFKNWFQRLSIKKPKEVLKPLPFHQVCFHNPNHSHRINIIDPKYIKYQDDLQVITSGFMSNLSSESGSDNQIFASGAQAAMNGVIWRLKIDYPQYCNWAVAASILMQKNVEELLAFIEKNRDAMLLAKPFFDARGNERLISSFQNSISDTMVKVVSPKTFYVLSGNDFDLNLNDVNPSILLLINLPGKESFYNPLVSMVFESVKVQMSQRHGHPSVMLLDEAGQIKFKNLYNIPALLRSFNIGTVFGIQDKVQGTIIYKENELFSLLANLSTKFFGKSNLPQTSKFYESYFELVKKKQFSKTNSSSNNGGGGTSQTISEREVAKHRSFEFERLGEGEFHVFDEKGKHHFKKWDAPKGHGKIPSKKINDVTETELINLYNQILDLGRTIE